MGGLLATRGLSKKTGRARPMIARPCVAWVMLVMIIVYTGIILCAAWVGLAQFLRYWRRRRERL